jgi:hypothetical protein
MSTVAELKELCKQHKLTVGGTKAELIKRLEENKVEIPKKVEKAKLVEKSVDKNDIVSDVTPKTETLETKPEKPKTEKPKKITDRKITDMFEVKSKSEKTEKMENKEEKLSTENLVKMTISELKVLCKKNNLTVGGTKAELIARLVGNPNEKSDKANKSTDKKQPVSNKKLIADNRKSVINTLMDKNKTIAISQNSFNNYEHAETHLVFDKLSKKVIGYQEQNGSVRPLNKNDIDVCNQFMFDYVLPDNLGVGKTEYKNSSDYIEEEDDDNLDIEVGEAGEIEEDVAEEDVEEDEEENNDDE